MSDKYLIFPWNMEDTIENLKELKEILQEKLIVKNKDGLGEKDAEELGFDLDRAIEGLEKQIAKKPVKVHEDGYRYTDAYRCPTCEGNFSGTGISEYCYHCGQKLDWSVEDELYIWSRK